VTTTEVIYDGEEYLVGDRDSTDVRTEVEAILATGQPGWIVVSHGRGRLQEAHLLVTPGIALSVLTIEGGEEV